MDRLCRLPPQAHEDKLDHIATWHVKSVSGHLKTLAREGNRLTTTHQHEIRTASAFPASRCSAASHRSVAGAAWLTDCLGTGDQRLSTIDDPMTASLNANDQFNLTE